MSSFGRVVAIATAVACVFIAACSSSSALMTRDAIGKSRVTIEQCTGPDASSEALALSLVERLPLDVTWTVASNLDLNCDSLRDYVFVAHDRTHYYVAAAVAPFASSPAATYVRFALGGDSQDALCGEPGELQEEAPDADVVESLGHEPEGWVGSASCKGLRLAAGDCDSFHLYWNVRHKKLDWWRL